jgi:hypothetical protein
MTTHTTTLPAQQAYAILAHYLGEEPYRAVAARYWRSEKAANMAVCRGLKKLREKAKAEHLLIDDFQSESFRGMLDQALFQLSAKFDVFAPSSATATKQNLEVLILS